MANVSIVDPTGDIALRVDIGGKFGISAADEEVLLYVRITHYDSVMQAPRMFTFVSNEVVVPVHPDEPNSVGVLRTIPNVVPAGVASTLEVDVEFDLAEACSQSPFDCIIRVDATQGGEAASAELAVWDRPLSTETIALQLSSGFVPGVIAVVVTARSGDVEIARLDATVPVRAMESSCQGSQEKKNVLFLMVDDLGTQVGA